MDRIICLVGESGSGKTTIAKELEKEGYNIIHSYTTRPPREPNEWGHIFIEDEDVREIARANLCEENIEDCIAYTFYNGHHYWATKKQYKGKGNSIYIIDPKGVEKLYDELWDEEVSILVIYLKCDEEKRIYRICERTGLNGIDLIEKMNRVEELTKDELEVVKRVENDREKFKLIECNYVIDANQPLPEVLKLVKEVINV